MGKDRSRLFEPAIAEYAGRLSHHARFQLVELPASRKADPDQARRDEGDRLLSLRSARDWLVALDERGQAYSSVELSSFLGAAQSNAKDLLFVVGGDEGLDEAVRRGADRVLSLSRMTLPHRLARLVLLEQLYRGFTLLKGQPYHK